MSLALPTSLSPSKVASFKDCALAFRYRAIDRLPEPPSPYAAKGTLVHRALELLMWEEPAGRRTLPVALEKLERARIEVLGNEEFAGVDLGEETEQEFLADAEALVRNYFRLEDPNEVVVVGTELLLSVDFGGVTLRGIIDRLDLDTAGQFVVTDYKTGRAPDESYEQTRLGGVHFYAFLCEQMLDRRPARVQLLHLREPLTISTAPTEQSVRGVRQQARALWDAIELACRLDDFRPHPGPMCATCAFRQYCPAVGGDPALAAAAVAARQAASEAAAVTARQAASEAAAVTARQAAAEIDGDPGVEVASPPAPARTPATAPNPAAATPAPAGV